MSKYTSDQQIVAGKTGLERCDRGHYKALLTLWNRMWFLILSSEETKRSAQVVKMDLTTGTGFKPSDGAA